MTQAERKNELIEALGQARDRTLWLLDQVPEEFLKRRVHNFYSPIGWHFGHIGRTEEYWVACQAFGRPCEDEAMSFLFADLPENPKDNRVNIPGREFILSFLERTRAVTLDLLDKTPLDPEKPFLHDGYAWEFALQHECQHQETIAEMLALIHMQMPLSESLEFLTWAPSVKQEWIQIPAGTFVMGSDEVCAYDNEKNAHPILVDGFELSKYPVTAYQWSQFIDDGGYSRRELWSDEGWAWREAEDATMPEYWTSHHGRYAYVGSMGARAVHPDEPVSCISAHEADAYCTWAGVRLPTEEEWEYAARFDPASGNSRRFPWGEGLATAVEAQFGLFCWGSGVAAAHPLGASAFGVEDMAGGVWEWTASPFLPYPGFVAFPYNGYSKDHMQGAHRVCRGGSWATAAPLLRSSFRNWYVPTYRQGFIGLRCAR